MSPFTYVLNAQTGSCINVNVGDWWNSSAVVMTFNMFSVLYAWECESFYAICDFMLHFSICGVFMTKAFESLPDRNRVYFITYIRKNIVSKCSVYAFSKFLAQRSTFTKFYNDLAVFICSTLIPQRVSYGWGLLNIYPSSNVQHNWDL